MNYRACPFRANEAVRDPVTEKVAVAARAKNRANNRLIHVAQVVDRHPMTAAVSQVIFNLAVASIFARQVSFSC